MFITLSEERNEKLLIEWSGEITDQHAQDYCDVCNAVFIDHFDLDYMRRKYEANIYGRSFIVVVYKDRKPIATQGAWRNDLDGKTAFQLCDFATLPEARKGGYILDVFYAICDEIRKSYPEGIIYGFPNHLSYPIAKALGQATAEWYSKIYHGFTQDFAENMPVIDDEYVNAFLLKKKNLLITEIKGRYYLVLKRRIKRLIPGGTILGEVSSKFSGNFRHAGKFRLCIYLSSQPGILGRSHKFNVNKYCLGKTEQVMGNIPPLYKADGLSIDFNGINKH